MSAQTMRVPQSGRPIRPASFGASHVLEAQPIPDETIQSRCEWSFFRAWLPVQPAMPPERKAASMNLCSVQKLWDRIKKAFKPPTTDRPRPLQDLREGTEDKTLECLKNIAVWIGKVQFVTVRRWVLWHEVLREMVETVRSRSHALEKGESISEEVKGIIATYLLARSIPFSMLPLPESRYLILVPAREKPGLRAEIERVQERGVVDDDETLTWFRYKGALISYIEKEPGYTAEYHYRYQSSAMEAPMEFDVRDLATYQKGDDHSRAIKAAIDNGDLHAEALLLEESSIELWELS
jgi:hypothetical protein